MRTVPRRISSASLFAAVSWSVVVLLMVAWLVLWVTNIATHHQWNPLRLNVDPMPWADRLKYAAATATGLGATVALVVNYRKQRDAEQSSFSVSFADASAQLGSDAPAVRIGGVYALAALADRQSDRYRRQQCIDALCGYLRLPYSPEAGAGHITTVVREQPGLGTGTTTTTSSYRPADREVRLTILSVIAAHLRDPNIPTSWCGHDLDFTGATFDGGNFDECHFSGGRVTFYGANFCGGRVTFDWANFSGGRVTFYGATFSGGAVIRNGQDFRGWPSPEDWRSLGGEAGPPREA